MAFYSSEGDLSVSGAEQKKNKSVGIIAGVCALVLIGGVTVLYNFVPAVKNTVRMAVMKPSDYLETVQTENLRSLSGDMAQRYQITYDYYNSDSFGADMNVDIAFHEPALIEEDSDMEINKMNIGVDLAMNSEAISEKIAFNVNDTDLGAIDVIMDVVDGEYFFNIPGLTENFVTFKDDEYTNLNRMFNYKWYNSAFTPEYLENFCNTYGDIFTKHLIECDITLFKNFKGEAAGVEYKYNVVSADVSEKQAYEMIKEMLETMKNDSQLKTVFDNYMKNFESIYTTMDSEAGESPNFENFMDERLTEINEDLETASEQAEVTVCVSVDPNGTIRGYSIGNTETEEKYGYAVAKQGNTYGIDVYGEEGSVVEVNLTESGGAYTGVCNLNFDDVELGIGINNFKIENEKIGTVSGSLSMDLSELEENLGDFELVFSAEGETQKISSDIPDTAEFSMDYTILKNPEIPVIPSDAEFIEDISEEKAEEWLKGIFDKLGWSYEDYASDDYYDDDYYLEDDSEYLEEDEYLYDEDYVDYSDDIYQEVSADISEYEIKIDGNSVLMPTAIPKAHGFFTSENGYISELTEDSCLAMYSDNECMVEAIYSEKSDSITENTPVDYIYITDLSGSGISPIDISVEGIKIGSSYKAVADILKLDKDEVSASLTANGVYVVTINDENDTGYYIAIQISESGVSGIELSFNSYGEIF